MLLLICTLIASLSYGQNSGNGLKMTSNYSSDNPEIRDIMEFEGIDYYKIKFEGKDLIGKSYHLTVKEFLNGNIVSDSTIINSKEIPHENFQIINDSIFSMKIISKLTPNKKLKMNLRIGRFGFEREFYTIEAGNYKLRNIAEESRLKIGYNKKFCLMAYIMPYEKANGIKSYCDVMARGNEAINWWKIFGLKHYFLFELKFE